MHTNNIRESAQILIIYRHNNPLTLPYANSESHLIHILEIIYIDIILPHYSL